MGMTPGSSAGVRSGKAVRDALDAQPRLVHTHGNGRCEKQDFNAFFERVFDLLLECRHLRLAPPVDDLRRAPRRRATRAASTAVLPPPTIATLRPRETRFSEFHPPEKVETGEDSSFRAAGETETGAEYA